MVARMVRKGSRLADIGTDHAYLPAALILDGTIESAIAADLRKGPLENAEATVRSYSIAHKVQLRLSDGLKAISPDEADDIAIAGMGGNLISGILDCAPWVQNENIRLILQPQSHEELVRSWLWDNGFEIIAEDSCFEDGKVYICIVAEYSGRVHNYTEFQALVGSLWGRNDEASAAYCEKKLRRIRVRLQALRESDPENEEISLLEEILNEVK